MTLTKSLTKVGMTAAVFGITGGFMAVSAETAIAASTLYTVDAEIQQVLQGGSSSPVGSLFGSFKYDTFTNTYSSINLTTKFTAGLFKGFTETYDTFVSGSVDTLSANNASFGEDIAGVSLVFPFLDSISIGSTTSLLSGSVAFGQTSEPFNVAFYTPVKGNITAVPTPALLPGLIGLGVAALRRKDEESAEENA